jgi:hypothetical protein
MVGLDLLIVDNQMEWSGLYNQECIGWEEFDDQGEIDPVLPGHVGVEVVVTDHSHVARDWHPVARDQLPDLVQTLD